MEEREEFIALLMKHPDMYETVREILEGEHGYQGIT